MNPEDEYLNSSLWYREQISDPYLIIASFFSVAGIGAHRNNIHTLMKCASSKKNWRGKNTSAFLDQMKYLESLINASFLLNKEKRQVRPFSKRDYGSSVQLFYREPGEYPQWDSFPRMLSWQEFLNPYLAIHRFFTFRKLSEWKQELEDIADYAMSSTSLFEAGIEADVLSIFIHLNKLVEAAYLIHVRENGNRGFH